MNIANLLQDAGVPPTLWPEAQACLDRALETTGGTLGAMTWRKHFVRFFRAGKIAKMLPWTANRLLDVDPDLAAWDIAPMLNITSNGDNGAWVSTPDGGRPIQDSWLDPDPTSADYRAAVDACYWAPGHHPRSPEARKAWYRRNACEYAAWDRGSPVGATAMEWSGNGITVLRSGPAWHIFGVVPWLGPLKMKVDIGYAVGNVFGVVGGRRVQCWYPLPSHELRACVVWVRHPTWSKA